MPLTSRVPGYEITEVIYEAENTTVYRAKSQKNNLPAILKVVKAEFSTPEQVYRLKREFKICENLNLEGVVKVHGLESSENQLILVMEDFGGISLKDFFSTHTLSLEIFLLIAIQLAESLASLHSRRIIHKDIKPSNIIINPQTLQVKITDFSIAARFQDVELGNSTQLEGTLSYISPEQTGRINRKVDYRTDFYSLGITFYELLTGQLPFASNDPLEIVYGHTALYPTPIRELSQNLYDEIPEAIESIITKLMAKNPDARYQNASELLTDLQQCLNHWKTTDKLTNKVILSNKICEVSSTTTSKEVLDLATVIKATSAISSEIVLDKLLLKLLHIIIENASAQIGCIILERDNELFIEVADTNQDVSVIQLQSTPVNTSSDIPVTVVNYVATTKKSLVLIDASQEDIFIEDPYILKKQPKSILCTPIFYQTKFLGVVYLENNHYTGAFTQERLQILKVLTSQAAIAIENARLFSAEQQKSQQLAESLNKLAQQEEQYRNVFENTIDGLAIYDLELGKYLAVNKALCEIYGYEASEWSNVQTLDFIHPDSQYVLADFLDYLNAGKEFYCEALVIRKDGTLIDVEVKANAITYNGRRCALSVSRDITERKQVEAELRQKEEQYRGIFETVTDGIGIFDIETGKLLASNPAYYTMHGYTYDEFIQLNPLEYIHPNSHHLFGECINAVKSGQPYSCLGTDIRKDGTLLDIEAKGIPYLLNNKPCILSVVQDITERKRTLEALSQRSQELSQTLLKLQRTQSQLVQTEKISQLGQLVAGVAHEVNNPVSFINGNLAHAKQYIEDLVNLVNLYQEKYPNPDSEIETEIENIDLDFLLQDLPKLIISMKLGTDRIRDIMQSLRNFSRSDTGEKTQIDIHQSIDTTLIVLSHRLKAKPERPVIQIIKEYAKLPLVPCFSGQINQVFMNLLANAIDALEDSNTGKTYLEIEKNPNQIKISTELINDSTPYIQIKIADNGLGMTEEVRQKLFDAFFTTKVEGKGTGLGLSISNQIITETHNGKLECFSSPGKGAEFVIKLPLTN